MLAAREVREHEQNGSFKRDEMLLKSALLLSDAYVRKPEGKTQPSLSDDLRRVCRSLPSANLYKG